MNVFDQLRAQGLSEKQERLLKNIEETQHLLRAEARMEAPRRIGDWQNCPTVFDPGGDDWERLED